MEPFIWAKVFDFSWTTITKILSFIFKVLVIVGLPALALWIIYAATIKPHTNPTPTTTQAGTGDNYNYEIKIGFGGCARLPIKGNK